MVLRSDSEPWMPGSSIGEAIDRTLAIAQAGNMHVEILFNGTPIYAQPTDTIAQVTRSYERARDRIQAENQRQADLQDRAGLQDFLMGRGMGAGLHNALRDQVVKVWVNEILESTWFRRVITRAQRKGWDEGFPALSKDDNPYLEG